MIVGDFPTVVQDQLQFDLSIGYLRIIDSKRIEADQRIVILFEHLLSRSIENLDVVILLLDVPMPNANDEIIDRVDTLRYVRICT